MKSRINLSVLVLLLFSTFGLELYSQTTAGANGIDSVSGIRRVHRMSTTGTISKVTAIDSIGTMLNFRYTVVGGGGGGTSSSANGPGGGGGEVLNLSTPTNYFNVLSSINATVGAGGAPGSQGNSSAISFTHSGGSLSVTARGGNTNAGGLSVGSSINGTTVFGPGTSSTNGGNFSTGGGAGNSAAGSSLTASSKTGGAGGAGLTITDATQISRTYGGGGGGAGNNTAGAGLNGGGAGGANTGNAANGIANTGGGGGAAASSGSVGGTGGSGVVIISYEGFDYFSGGAWTWLNPPAHTSGAAVKIFTSTALGASSWGTDDIYVKSGQTLTIDGAVVCRNLYCDGSVIIGTGSLTVNNTFFAQRAQAIPVGTYKNIWCTLTSGVVSIPANLSISGNLNVVNSAATFDISGSGTNTPTTFTCGGLINGSGHIKGNSNSILVYTGSPTSSSSTLYMDSTTQGTTNVLRRLELGTNAKLRLMNNLFITADRTNNTDGDIKLASGSLLETNDSAGVATTRLAVATNGNAIPPRLFLKRNTNSSIHHPILKLLGGQIVGEVWYEDYFESGSKSWRQTGHVLDSAMALSQWTADDLDLYADVVSGSGGRSGNPNGLLASSTAALPSIFRYDENQLNASSSNSRWVPYQVNGNTIYSIPPGVGVMLFMRPYLSGTTGSYQGQQYDYEGQLNTSSNVVVTCVKSTNTAINTGYNLLANPYPSYLNLESFLNDPDNSSKIANGSFGSGSGALSIYKYDKGTKNYKPTYKSGSSWKNSSGTTLTVPNMDPGDAFFVRVSSNNVSLTFKPSHTSTQSEVNLDRGNKLEVDTLKYFLLHMKMFSNLDNGLGDAVTITSANDNSNLYLGTSDVLDMRGTCLDFSVQSSNNANLAVKQVSNTTSWTIPLKVNSCLQGDHRFSCSISSINLMEDANFELLDLFKGTRKKLNDGDTITFQITSDPLSYGVGRFFIVTNPSSAASVIKHSTKKQININPNPVKYGEDVQLFTNCIGKGQCKIYDAAGRLVWEREYAELPCIIKINSETILKNQGVYTINLATDHEILTQRLLLTNE